jgi:DNA-binding GntR family transcriptional regulator
MIEVKLRRKSRRIVGQSLVGLPLIVESKSALIRQRLYDAIINGELKPGERLVLDSLARDLGTSKIPIREALSSLEGAGLVTQNVHTGPRVALLPFHEVRGIYLLREEIETLAMRAAMVSAEPPRIDRLLSINDKMKTLLESGDEFTLTDLNTEFHLTIARATTYQTIAETVEDLLLKVRRYRAISHRLAANWRLAVEEHDAVILAVIGGDPTIAETAMRVHVSNQRQLEIADELATAERTAFDRHTPLFSRNGQT